MIGSGVGRAWPLGGWWQGSSVVLVRPGVVVLVWDWVVWMDCFFVLVVFGLRGCLGLDWIDLGGWLCVWW